MALWEFRPSGQMSRSIETKGELPSDSDYGSEYDYDTRRPSRTVAFAGRGFNQSELDAVVAAASARGGAYSLTDSNSVAHSGKILSLSWEQIEGTALYEVSLQLKESL